MASLDPTLTALAVYSAYKLISSYFKSKKAKRMIEGEEPMNENTKNLKHNFFKSTIYNALCGVIGNAIYDLGKEMPALANPLRRVFAF